MIMLTGMVGFSQAYTLYGQKDQTYWKSTTDVNIDTTKAKYIIIDASHITYPTTRHFYAEIDSVVGNHTAVAVTLHGRNFDGEGWTSLPIIATNLGVDSKIPVHFHDTIASPYRKFKITFTGTGNGRSKLDVMEFKLFSTRGW